MRTLRTRMRPMMRVMMRVMKKRRKRWIHVARQVRYVQ
jgi:hypothetical protein